ncbi:hypothetical protein EAO77_37565 [Streptomyces sp. t39]|nr:hypothetical protein EAO77_37565 [Streptomyces sp. t39]
MNTMRAIRDALRDREQRIVDEMLQAPDYPPLPPCPHCGAASQNIGHHKDLMWFQPCGHRFTISMEVKLALLP